MKDRHHNRDAFLFRKSSFFGSCTVGILSVLMLVLLTFSAQAQEATVSGTVLSAGDEEPLPGVNIVEVGTQRGTTTNENGEFTLRVSSSEASLQFTFIGFASKSVDINGESEITVLLEEKTAELEGVVVTALGQEKERRKLGYSISDVGSDEMIEATEGNFANLLQGQVSGMKVEAVGGGPGSSSRVTIRGASSLTDDNQPLYVIDGIPIDNSNIGSAGMWGGFEGGDGLQSINSDDIENVSILKGAAAAAMYGSRARDGVVLITTKQGESGRTNVSFTSNTTIDQARIDHQDYQTQYGQGSQGRRPQTEGEAHATNMSSWGEPFDGQSTIQWDGKKRPYKDLGSKVGSFYRNAISSSNALSVNGGVENATYYFSASHLNNEGIIPNTDKERTSLTIRGTAEFGRLNADLKANYIDESTTRQGWISDMPANINTVVNRLARNVPISSFKDNYKDEEGREISPVSTIFGPFIQNPYWVFNEFDNWDNRDRLIGHAKFDFELTDWLSATARTGLDWYTLRRHNVEGWGTGFRPQGAMSESENRIREVNTDFFFTADYQLTSSLTIDGTLGSAVRNRQRETVGARGAGFTIPGLNTLSNMAQQSAIYNFSEKEIRSLYGTFDIGYNDYLFLNLTGRNDWSSTLPADNNSFFYPSASLSFLFHEVFELPEWLSHGKVRASWAEVGSDTDPYMVDLTYTFLPGDQAGQPLGYIAQNSVPLANLKPTITQESELGFDIRFFDDRIRLDFARYDRETTNQILSTNISSATGFNGRVINAGRLDNTGFEVKLTTFPVSQSDFFWKSTVNYSRNKSEVAKLVEDQELLELGTSRSRTAFVTAQVGEEFGTIRGYAYERDEQGNIVHKNGLPVQGELTILGRGTPSWSAGWSNKISYRNFTFNTLIDVEWGGQIYSYSNALQYSRGLHKNTLNGRAECDQNKTSDGRWASDCFVGEGVDIDGGPNETGVTPDSYYGRIGSQIAEEFIYDKNLITMRQIQLAYNIPAEWYSGLGIQSASVSVVGRNLFFLYNPIPNVDPEASINRGNAQGLESEGIPHTRTFGLNVNLKF